MARKSGLGKGLGLLVGEANTEASVSAPDSMVSIARIKPNKNQPRKAFDEKELEALTDSVRQNGILQPLLVRREGNDYEIVAGERRYQAARAAGLAEVPVIVREVSDDDMFKLALIENLQRSDLNPIEEAEGYNQLIKDKGLTQEELAGILSKSRPAIANALRLLDLPSEVRDLVAEGRLSAGHARAVLAVSGDEGRVRLAWKAADEKLSVRQTESLAPLFSVGEYGTKAQKTPQPQSFKRAAKELRRALGTNVRVRTIRGRNKVEIDFSDEEELARIVELLTRQEG